MIKFPSIFMGVSKNIPKFEKYKSKYFALVDQAIISGTNFVLAIFLGRFLGLEVFGEYVLLWLAVQLNLSVHSALVTTPMVSIGPKKNEQQKVAYYQETFITSIAFGVFVFFLSWMLGGVVIEKLGIKSSNSLIFSLSIIFGVVPVQDFLRRYSYCRLRPNLAALLSFTFYVPQLILVPFLGFQKQLDITNFFSMSAICCGVSILVGVVILKPYTNKINVDLNGVKENFHMAKWLLTTAISQWMSSNLLTAAAGVALGMKAAGAVRAAQNIMGVTHVFFQAIENIAGVNASKLLASNGVGSLYLYVAKIARRGGMVVMFFSIFVAFQSDYILKVIYGLEYVDYAWVLSSYAVIYILLFLGFPLRIFFRSLEETFPIFFAYVLSASFTTYAAFVLVPSYEIKGLVFSVFLANAIIVSTLGFFMLKKVRG